MDREEDRFPPFLSSHRPPRTYYFFYLSLFSSEYPTGASAKERALGCFTIKVTRPSFFLGGYHPTLKLSDIFTLLLS